MKKSKSQPKAVNRGCFPLFAKRVEKRWQNLRNEDSYISSRRKPPARSWIEATFHGRECVRFIPNPKLETGRERRVRSRSSRPPKYSRMNVVSAKSSELSVGSPKRKRKRENSPRRRNKNAPRSPFINFFREYRSKHRNVPIVKMASNVSKIWNNMSTKQKKKYIHKNSRRRGGNSNALSGGFNRKKRKAIARTDSLSSTVTRSASQKSLGVTETTSATQSTLSRTHSDHSEQENR